MKYEKSCGAVIFRINDKNEREYFLIFNKKGNAEGHWGFPKGHIEGDETEHECAVREILEETGLSVKFIDTFRAVSTYSPKEGITKDAVYFAAIPVTDNVTLQISEVCDYGWYSYAAAMDTLTHDMPVLEQCEKFLREI